MTQSPPTEASHPEEKGMVPLLIGSIIIGSMLVVCFGAFKIMEYLMHNPFLK